MSTALARMKPGPHRFQVPLVAAIVTVGFDVAAPNDGLARFIAIALLIGAVLLSLQAAETQRSRREVSIAIVLVAGLLVTYGSVGSGSPTVKGIGQLIVALPIILAAVRVVMWIGRQKIISGQAVLGGVLVYLLIGIMFAQIYGGIGDLSSAQFFCAQANPTQSDRMYFSFITITTTGYGDFVPCTQIGHSFAMTEAMFGQIYLVTIIALLIGNLGRRRVTRDEFASDSKADDAGGEDE